MCKLLRFVMVVRIEEKLMAPASDIRMMDGPLSRYPERRFLSHNNASRRPSPSPVLSYIILQVGISSVRQPQGYGLGNTADVRKPNRVDRHIRNFLCHLVHQFRRQGHRLGISVKL